jgi:hypothetical protein
MTGEVECFNQHSDVLHVIRKAPFHFNPPQERGLVVLCSLGIPSMLILSSNSVILLPFDSVSHHMNEGPWMIPYDPTTRSYFC